MSLPAIYEKLLDLSRQMQDLALRQDWDALTRCEAARAALIAAMPPRPVLRTPEEVSAVASCLRQVQEYDRQILNYVEPWREQVAMLLSRLPPSSQGEAPSQTELAPSTTDSRAP